MTLHCPFNSNRSAISWVLAICVFAVGLAGHRASATDSFESVMTYLTAHCSKCHNSEKTSGGIDLTQLKQFEPENAHLWQDILNNIQRGDMPPDDAPSQMQKVGVSLRASFVSGLIVCMPIWDHGIFVLLG